jgi:hypothetical protein
MVMITDILTHFSHHLLELFKINQSVSVFVEPLNHIFPCVKVEATKDLSEMIDTDLAA